MKRIWAYLVEAASKDDLLDRVTYLIFGIVFLSLGLAVFIEDPPNELSMHAALTGWALMTMLGIVVFFVFMSCKKGYKRKILDTPGSGKIVIFIFPAILLTIALRLFGVSGRKYLVD